MKCCLAFVIAIASYSLAQAQDEVQCKLLDIAASDWNNTVSVGTCSTSPQLWKRVTYQSTTPPDLGIKWSRICDTCSTPYGEFYKLDVAICDIKLDLWCGHLKFSEGRSVLENVQTTDHVTATLS